MTERAVRARVEPHPSRHSQINMPRGFSSFGRAPPCQGGGGGFEPRNPLHKRHPEFTRGCFLSSIWGSNEFEFHSSRIVLSLRLRKSPTCLTPCFVEHRSQKQHSVVFVSLTRNPLHKRHSTRVSFFFFSVIATFQTNALPAI